MFACNGILFNHESPIRGETFVTRKITRAASKIALGLQDKLFLGNLNSNRDWGHAKDYIEAMYLILQQDTAEDFVIATGVTTEIREFVRKSFAWLGIEVAFKGENEAEIGFIKNIDTEKAIKLGLKLNSLTIGKEIIAVDPRYYRPTEVDLLVGDATKSRTKLGWVPKYDLNGLIDDMMQSDLHLMMRDQYLDAGGFKTLSYFE
jgi:GDPmannose 4,6-dehydratase